jgi:L-rhamnose isomerase
MPASAKGPKAAKGRAPREGTAIMTDTAIDERYRSAQGAYAALGVDTDRALEALKSVSISIHCWQGDDVGGFEHAGAELAGSGLQVTGSYPGKARGPEELRSDIDAALALIPGRHRVNLHAIYGDFRSGAADRDAIGLENFRGWIEWARERDLKLDFNATCFGHPKADAGFTLSHPDKAIRRFWIDHVKCCRRIAAAMGRELKSPCLHNLWIPDGSKEIPADRLAARTRLRESLDEIFTVEHSPHHMLDSLESKLFGIGSESFVVGSHEFYLGYALSRGKLICLDLGHFHPTESVADKVSALLLFAPGLVFHLSRGVRWDSDHVVVLNEEVRAVAEEIVRARALERVHIALDYFDGSINRIAAWVLGARAALKAVLAALLLPEEELRRAEAKADGARRLALREEAATLPLGAIWDRHCRDAGVPPAGLWIEETARYEREVLARRVEGD